MDSVFSAKCTQKDKRWNSQIASGCHPIVELQDDISLHQTRTGTQNSQNPKNQIL